MNKKTKSPLPLDEEVEVSPGYIVQRRSVLVGLGGLAIAGLPMLARPELIGFDRFLDEANPLAQALLADISAAGQDHYLRSIAALAARIDTVPFPDRWIDTDQGETPGSYRIGFNPGGDPFTVLHWRLEPGAKCRPHAHTYGNVVSIGLEGVARVANYEVVGQPNYGFDGTFRVRQTVDQLLGAGDINLVSLERNYIHGFEAGPEGARGLDITTRLKPRPAHDTPFLDIRETPLDTFMKIYEASWNYNE